MRRLFTMLLVVVFVVCTCSYSFADAWSSVENEVATEINVMPRLKLGPKWSNIPRTVMFENQLGTSWDSAITAAMNKWNAVKSTSGSNMVTLSRTTETVSNQIRYGVLSSSVNAKTDIYDNGTYISYVYIIVNSTKSFSNGATSGKIDMQSLMEHELGHALGIAHCHETADYPNGGPCWSSTCLTNVMQPVLSTGVSRRTLTSYDTASYKSIYS